MPDMKKNFQLIFISLSVFFLLSCSRTFNSINMNNQKTDLGTSSSKFLDQTYISESLDFALYNAWLNLDSALSLRNTSDSEEKYNSNQIQEKIATAQNIFLQKLEKEKNLKTYRIANNIYGIKNQIQDMEEACKRQDAKELSRLVTAFYITKGLLYQKSGTVFVQLILSMSILLLLVIILLLFYQLTYARRIEIEKILKATNKGQEEERRRLALELHDSVAQQMRYVSLLAEKIEDKELAQEIKMNQGECIENIRNSCYTLSSINMDKGSFTAALKNENR